MTDDGSARAAAVALAALAFLSEFNTVAAGPLGTGLVRWAILAAVWLAPLGFLVVRTAPLVDVLTRSPLSWIGWWMVWTVVAAAWSPSANGRSGLLATLGIVACWLYPIWFVSIYGWTRFCRVIAAGALVFLTASAAYAAVSAEGWRDDRLAGLAWSPTHLSRIGALAVLLGLYLATRRRRGDLRLGGACVVAGGVAAVLSDTRTGLVALAVVGFVALLRSRSSGRTILLGSGLALLGIVVALVAVPDDGRDLASGTGRTEIWRVTLERVLQAPILGTGTDSGEIVFNDVARDGDLAWQAFTAHNAFLHVLLTQGVVGLGLLIAACAGYVAVARRARDVWRDSLVLLLFVNAFTEALVEQPSLASVVLAAAFAAATNDAAVRGGLRGGTHRVTTVPAP